MNLNHYLLFIPIFLSLFSFSYSATSPITFTGRAPTSSVALTQALVNLINHINTFATNSKSPRYRNNDGSRNFGPLSVSGLTKTFTENGQTERKFSSMIFLKKDENRYGLQKNFCESHTIDNRKTAMFSGQFTGVDATESDILHFLRSCGLEVAFELDSGFSMARIIASVEAVNKIIKTNELKVLKNSSEQTHNPSLEKCDTGLICLNTTGDGLSITLCRALCNLADYYETIRKIATKKYVKPEEYKDSIQTTSTLTVGNIVVQCNIERSSYENPVNLKYKETLNIEFNRKTDKIVINSSLISNASAEEVNKIYKADNISMEKLTVMDIIDHLRFLGFSIRYSINQDGSVSIAISIPKIKFEILVNKN